MKRIKVNFNDPKIIQSLNMCKSIDEISQLKEFCIVIQILLHLHLGKKSYTELRVLTESNANTITKNIKLLVDGKLIRNEQNDIKKGDEHYYIITKEGKKLIPYIKYPIEVMQMYSQFLTSINVVVSILSAIKYIPQNPRKA